MGRRIGVTVCLILLMGCTPRGAVTLAPEAAGIGVIEPIFIGTTREQEQDGSFGSHRSQEVRFARYDVQIPPNRTVGEINWPARGAVANPAKHFLTTDQVVYQTGPAFQTDLAQQLATTNGEAVIFVHGYNSNFAEGVYRVAQFAHDLELPGTVVLYSWPSAAEPLGYAYDRDSALFARDGLERLIHEVARAGAKRILLVAHSMGGGLTMEALRTAAVRGDQRTLDRLGGVVLISPDIDVDVFREQASAIGELPQPFVIFGTDRDKVLRLSAALTGQEERLGSLSDVSRLTDLAVTFLDVGEFAEGSGHFVMGDSPALISLMGRIADIQGAFEADRQTRLGLLPGALLTVQNATQIVLRPLAQVASGVVR